MLCSEIILPPWYDTVQSALVSIHSQCQSYQSDKFNENKARVGLCFSFLQNSCSGEDCGDGESQH